ncbi:MAG: hypothetical protein LKJ76_03915 [Lachnospiraceae bacterium]|jgi:hypothetical protein|nr:hypothetical protein [Lachnospiraceae bacterium]
MTVSITDLIVCLCFPLQILIGFFALKYFDRLIYGRGHGRDGAPDREPDREPDKTPGSAPDRTHRHCQPPKRKKYTALAEILHIIRI